MGDLFARGSARNHPLTPAEPRCVQKLCLSSWVRLCVRQAHGGEREAEERENHDFQSLGEIAQIKEINLEVSRFVCAILAHPICKSISDLP